MATYVCGPSRLSLTGHAQAIQPGSTFEHDFSETGPEGIHGLAREAALLAGGALLLPPVVTTDRPTGRPLKEKE